MIWWYLYCLVSGGLWGIATGNEPWFLWGLAGFTVFNVGVGLLLKAVGVLK